MALLFFCLIFAIITFRWLSVLCCAGKMQQPKMGAAQHGPMNGMHNWDPMLAGYMQMMASQLYGGNPIIHKERVSVHPSAGLRLSGKFQAVAAAGTNSWTPYGGLMDFPDSRTPYGGLMDFPAVLHRKYEPKEQIGRYGNVNEFVIR